MTVETIPGAGAFTNEILVKNFTAIGKEFNNIAQWQRHIEEHIGELYEFAEKAGRLAQAAAKPKGMKTKHKVLLAVGVGLYFGRKSMKKEFNERLEQVKKEASDKFDAFVADQRRAQAQGQSPVSAAKEAASNLLGDPPQGDA
jgi:hypothetical protein